MADGNPNYSTYNGMVFSQDLTSLVSVPEGMRGNAVLPDSLANVPACVFSRCIKLSAISFTGGTGATSLTSENGILYTSDKSTLLAAPAGLGTTAVIASECTSIVEGAFAGNTNLETIVVDDTVRDIASGGVSQFPIACSSADDLSNAAVNAFADETVAQAAVALNVPSDQYDAAKAAWEAAGFQNFTQLATPGDTTNPAEGESGFAYTLLDDYTLAVGWSGNDSAPEALEIPEQAVLDGVTYPVSAIAANGFAGQTSIATVSMPTTLAYVGAGAFEGCEALEAVDIPDNVSSIGNSAFKGCSALVSVALGDGLRTLGEGALSGILADTIVLPASVKSVGDYAFANSPNLVRIVCMGEIEEVGSAVLSGCAGVDVYVPYNESGKYAWSLGAPAAGNHLQPYGAKVSENALELTEGDSADLFQDGYLEAPKDVEVSYSYKASPVSIDDSGTVTGKSEGSSVIGVSLTLAPLSNNSEVINVKQSVSDTPEVYGVPIVLASTAGAAKVFAASPKAAGVPLTIHSDVTCKVKIRYYNHDGVNVFWDFKKEEIIDLYAGGTYTTAWPLRDNWYVIRQDTGYLGNRPYLNMWFQGGDYTYADISLYVDNGAGELGGFAESEAGAALALSTEKDSAGNYVSSPSSSSDAYARWTNFPLTIHSDVSVTITERNLYNDNGQYTEISNNDKTFSGTYTLNNVYEWWSIKPSKWNGNRIYICARTSPYANGTYGAYYYYDLLLDVDGGSMSAFSLTKDGPDITYGPEPADGNAGSDHFFSSEVWIKWETFPLTIHSDISAGIRECSMRYDNGSYISISEEQKPLSGTYTIKNVYDWWLASPADWSGNQPYLCARTTPESNGVYNYYDLYIGVDGGFVGSFSYTQNGPDITYGSQSYDNVWVKWANFPLTIHSDVSATVTERCMLHDSDTNSEISRDDKPLSGTYTLNNVYEWRAIKPSKWNDNRLYIWTRTSPISDGGTYYYYDLLLGVDGGSVGAFSLTKDGPDITYGPEPADGNALSDLFYSGDVWVKWECFPLTIHSDVLATVNERPMQKTNDTNNPFESAGDAVDKPLSGTYTLNNVYEWWAVKPSKWNDNEVYICARTSPVSDGTYYYYDLLFKVDGGSIGAFSLTKDGPDLTYGPEDANGNSGTSPFYSGDVWVKWANFPLNVHVKEDSVVTTRYYKYEGDGQPSPENRKLVKEEDISKSAGDMLTVPSIEYWHINKLDNYVDSKQYIYAEYPSGGEYDYVDLIFTSTGHDIQGFSLTDGGAAIDVNVELNDPYGITGKTSAVLYSSEAFCIWDAQIYKLTLQHGNNTADSSIWLKYGVGYYDNNKCEGSTINSVAVPSRLGYTFKGYFTGDTERIGAGGEFNSANMGTKAFTADTTLIAVWDANKYTVVLGVNKPSDSVPEPSGNLDTINSGLVDLTLDDSMYIILPTSNNMPVKVQGYSLASSNAWVSSKDASKAYDSSVTLSQLLSDGLVESDGKTINLNAQWSVNSYKVVFAGGDSTAVENSGKVPATATVAYNEAITLPDDDAYLNTGYTFTGWNTKSVPGVLYTKSSTAPKVSALMAASEYPVNGSTITLNANWSAITYTIEYSAGTTDNNGTALIGTPPAITNAYQTLTMDDVRGVNGGDTSKAKITGDATLDFTGYDFGGWLFDSTSTGTPYESGNVIDATDMANLIGKADASGKIALFAKWTPWTFNVVWDGQGGTSGGNATVQASGVKYTDKLDAPVFNRSGYTLSSWITEGSGGSITADPADGKYAVSNIFATATNAGLSLGKGSTIKVLAVWSANSDGGFYKVEYYYQVQGGNFEHKGADKDGRGAPGEAFTLPESDYTKIVFTATVEDGVQKRYVFDADNDGNVLEVGDAGLSTDSAAPTVFKVYYKLQIQVIANAGANGHFDGNATQVTLPETGYFDYGDTVTLPTPLPTTAEAYRFEGKWFEGAATEVAVPATPLVATQDVTYTADWTPVEYTVVYAHPTAGADKDMNSQVALPLADSANSRTYTYAQLATATLENADANVGFTFDGWTVAANSAGDVLTAGSALAYDPLFKNVSGAVGTDKTLTLYSKCHAKTYTFNFYSNSSKGGSNLIARIENVTATSASGITLVDNSNVPDNKRMFGYMLADWRSAATANPDFVGQPGATYVGFITDEFAADDNVSIPALVEALNGGVDITGESATFDLIAGWTEVYNATLPVGDTKMRSLVIDVAGANASKTDDVTVYNYSPHELNLAARSVLAENTGSTTGPASGLDLARKLFLNDATNRDSELSDMSKVKFTFVGNDIPLVSNTAVALNQSLPGIAVEGNGEIKPSGITGPIGLVMSPEMLASAAAANAGATESDPAHWGTLATIIWTVSLDGTGLSVGDIYTFNSPTDTQGTLVGTKS